MFEVTVDETFAAGHALRNYKGKCENVHGHNYKVRVMLTGAELDTTGLLFDFVQLKQVIHGVIQGLDHKFLNETPPFDVLNPSAENIAKYFYEEATKRMQQPANGARITGVTIWETDTSAATYRP